MERRALLEPRALIKPRGLRAGGRVAVVSPAGAPRRALVERGMERLRGMGYEAVLMPSALAHGPLYYAGAVEVRVADVHAAFADPAVDAVFCTRGGWGSAEMLPFLDAALIRANAKPFVGFSDVTTLHLYLARECGLVSFYGPMVSPDFARGSSVAEGVDLGSFGAALGAVAPWEVGGAEGLRMLRAGRAGEVVRGRLFGGCLSLLVESLGTPWAVQAPAGDGILFLEDVGTKAYQWDRMLLHLRYAGLLEGVRGIVFGEMEQCLTATEPEARAAEMRLLEAALLHSLREFAGPVCLGLRCGHVHGPNVTLPLGGEAALDCSGRGEGGGVEPVLRLLEGAVVL